MIRVLTPSINSKQDFGELYSVHHEHPFGGGTFLANSPKTVYLNIVQ